ncbi:MAG: hypothetical protein HYW69_01685 [Candidatus Nealsonbacteria bacterium]|nr:hypothetical protein [Candidatus Nealsonbacteria bacterium]
MPLITLNQENNWAYILIIATWALIAGAFVVYYAIDTTNEINSLNQNISY